LTTKSSYNIIKEKRRKEMIKTKHIPTCLILECIEKRGDTAKHLFGRIWWHPEGKFFIIGDKRPTK
jgi:hypothetical protein